MDEIKKVVIDTNLLVRYLTEDEPVKAKAVDNLLNKAIKGELKIIIPSIVIAELTWILESFYQMEEEKISELIEAIINTHGIEVTDKALINSALKIYRTKKIDLIDAWIIEFAREKGIKIIYTFDAKHFKDIKGIETLSPS